MSLAEALKVCRMLKVLVELAAPAARLKYKYNLQIEVQEDINAFSSWGCMSHPIGCKVKCTPRVAGSLACAEIRIILCPLYLMRKLDSKAPHFEGLTVHTVRDGSLCCCIKWRFSISVIFLPQLLQRLGS